MADAYKTLVQAAVPTTAAMIGSAVGAAKSWIAKHIIIINTGTVGALTVQLFKNGTTAAYAFSGVMSVGPGGHAEWDGTEAFATGEYIAGVGSASGMYLVMSGDEVS